MCLSQCTLNQPPAQQPSQNTSADMFPKTLLKTRQTRTTTLSHKNAINVQLSYKQVHFC